MAVFSGNGSSGSPSFTFSSDTDSGLYRIFTNKIGLATGGADALTIDENQLVGIGTVDPAAALHVAKAAPGALTGNVHVEPVVPGQARYSLYNGGLTQEWLFGQKSSSEHSFVLSKNVSGSETDCITVNSIGRVKIGTGNAAGQSDFYALSITDSLAGCSGVLVRSGIATNNNNFFDSFVSFPLPSNGITYGGTHTGFRSFGLATGTTANLTAATQVGFWADANMNQAAVNYGFYGSISSGANRWNFYANGDADNYFNGTIASLGSYNSTTAAAANMVLEAGGAIRRSTSSIRYKTDVEDLESSYSDAVVLNARPVWYRSLAESDNQQWGWYGLIAEEVAEIDPRIVHWGYPVKRELVEPARDAVYNSEGEVVTPASEAVYSLVEDREAGLRPEGVQYERLSVLLLDFVQRQQKKIEALEARLQAANL